MKAIHPDVETHVRRLRLWLLGASLVVALGWGGSAASAHSLGCNPNGNNPHCDPPPGPTDTPELGSGELLLTGLVPVAGILLYRRRRLQRTAAPEGEC